MRRLRRHGGIAVALLAAAAVFAPTAPAADAPVPLPDTTALVDATLQATDPATTPDAESALEVVEEVTGIAAAAVEPHTTAPAVPVQTQPAPAEQPAAPAAKPPAPAPAPEAPAAAASAPAPAPEAPAASAGAPSETAAAAPAPLAQADVEQQRPVNVNISIRVESPGDNGSVSQGNTAVGAVAAELAAAPAAAQPEPVPDETEAGAEAAAAAAPESPTTASAVASTETWDWTWNWDCGGVISPDLVLPNTSSLPIWSWNWNWNCGADPAVAEKTETEIGSQYHGTTRQYQPVNVNISIRLSSPGNDGAVSQTNIAQAIVAVATSAARPVLSAGGKPAAGLSQASIAAAPPETPAAAPVESLAEVIVELTAEMVAEPLELGVDIGCCAVPAPFVEPLGNGGVVDNGVAEGTTPSPAPTGKPSGPKPDSEPADITAVLAAITPEATAAPRAVAALVVPKPRVEAARRAATHERLTKHVKHRAAPATERAAVLSYGGIGPLGAPDRTPKFLLLFLLPFVFALVAAARRVEDDDRAAAAEPGRPEGRPG